MPRWKIKRNALIQGLFYGFCVLNLAVAWFLTHGVDRVLLLTLVSGLALVVAKAVDLEPRRNTDGAAVCALAAHLLETAGLLIYTFFHWSIVVLYFLELALCIYIWRIKITR